jgi:hypothetical protein
VLLFWLWLVLIHSLEPFKTIGGLDLSLGNGRKLNIPKMTTQSLKKTVTSVQSIV